VRVRGPRRGGADAESGWPRVRPRLGLGCERRGGSARRRMTCGAHMSATSGARARGSWRTALQWAAMGREAWLGHCCVGNASRPKQRLGRGVGGGLRSATRPKRGQGGKGFKRKVFNFQTHSKYEFKPMFEFKHNKMMHHHVCNRELLYFIN
jgi:hypothetical protein